MTIGQTPAGVSLNPAAENSNTNVNTRPTKDTPAVSEPEKTDSEAYTLEITNTRPSATNTNATTTIKNENEALASALLTKNSILQNPANAAGTLAFNISRIASLMKGLTEPVTA
ncbi:hypothetical protein [Candidatus Magnetominusculus xianensis]|uniref:Uncharacterized protein n=1 Tax=Candidatus Magnetominusculus xianensis TaxID=1748249 RepID=A0ABR5SC63_9BACT|nr:hypothetical protein [Candidatus Magnetominusculus xianensis]KWT79573.1 hypothetical protein ASN18_2743 [Candidatus Magnetominusculus xianensis]MBF0405625.1 hypothetical protein [Nitrospirota bacterium]